MEDRVPITSEAVWTKLMQDPIFIARPKELRERIKGFIAPLIACILVKFPEDQKINCLILCQCRNIFNQKNFENTCATSNTYETDPKKKEMTQAMLKHNEEKLIDIDYTPAGMGVTEEEFTQKDLEKMTTELGPEALAVYQAGNLTIRELLLNFPFSLLPSLNPFFRQ